MSSVSPTGRTPLSRQVQAAKALLRADSVSARDVDELSKALIDQREFSYARRLLARSREQTGEDQSQRLRLAQRLARATMNDTDLPAELRLDRALAVLSERCTLRTTKNQETLGLGGSAFKRRWRFDGQKENLDRALAYYLRGYEQGPERDRGYTGINAAFVLDLLADVERREAAQAGSISEMANTRAEEARAIREELVETLTGMGDEEPELFGDWWFLATLAEAHFGLGAYEQAGEWLTRARSLDVPSWQYQATVRQLATVARMVGRAATVSEFAASGAGRVLKKFLGDHAEAVQGAYTGKVGLALSGGGFRASLFHIGTLARLAELDVLRHVEVLSCVSGGSIVGAHYYLLLRKLLQRKSDPGITRADYIELVEKLERDFLSGVQRNVRTRIATELVTNLKMIFLPGYSRTMRAGELYERYLYSRVRDGHKTRRPWWAPWRVRPRWLNELLTHPKGEDPLEFSPKHDNWRRCAKVPALVLNATTLNTGHNWQFTASWMGEPAGGVSASADGNRVLRRMYYWEAPPAHRRMRLGYAVAASACVPGLFEPLSLRRLYPDMKVELVDGGVHDNQGVASLLEQDCQVMLVSDASGQMADDPEPGRGPMSVPLRANSILMSRVRQTQFEHLHARHRSGLLRGLMVLHLKKDLDVTPCDWEGTDDPLQSLPSGDADAAPQDDRTSYGIPKDIQRRLAAVRTDLDSFNEAEAYSLMTSGYRMTEEAFRRDPALKSLTKGESAPEAWRFLTVEGVMGDARRRERLLELLDTASRRGFKIWYLSPELRVTAAASAAVATLALGLVAWYFRDVAPVTVGGLSLALLGLVGGLVIGKRVLRVADMRGRLARIGLGVVLSVFGPIVGRIHLWVFDRMYLRKGRLDNLL